MTTPYQSPTSEAVAGGGVESRHARFDLEQPCGGRAAEVAHLLRTLTQEAGVAPGPPTNKVRI